MDEVLTYITGIISGILFMSLLIELACRLEEDDE